LIPIRDANPALTRPVITWLIIAAAAYVFFAVQPDQEDLLGDFLFEYAAIPCELTTLSPLDAGDLQGCNVGDLGTPFFPRKNLLARWGKDFYHLLVAKVGEEGLDAPEVAYGIITAGSRTNRQNVQRVGRLMRPQPGKTAQLYVVYAQNTVEEKLLSLIQQVLG